jgi:hypothetical protein
MLVVQIRPDGVGEVAVDAPNDRVEDADLAVWPLVREELTRLDQRLQNEGPQLLALRRAVRQPPAGGAA